MFDNQKPHVIILTDHTNEMAFVRTLGPYKIASQLRKSGIGALVLNYLHAFSVEEIIKILNHVVNENTILLGVNDFWYRDVGGATYVNRQLVMPEWRGGSAAGAILPHGAEHNHAVISAAKSKNPNIKLVLGGPTAVDLEHNKIYDYVVQGFAESSVLELVKHIESPSRDRSNFRRSIWGFWYAQDLKADKYDFVNDRFRYDETDCVMQGETLPLEIGRGCIFSCKFCAFPLNGKKKFDYIKSFNLLRDELIDNWQRFNVTRYNFVDDTFNDSVQKCQMIYELNKSLPFQLEYSAWIRLDLLAAHPETIDLLYDSGLRSVAYGIESLDERASKVIGKGGSRQKLIDTLNHIKQHCPHLHQTGSFIFGLPYESEQSVSKTAEWLASDHCPLDNVAVFPLMIQYPQWRVYSSDFDKNYEKYGYEDLGPWDGDIRIMTWRSPVTTFADMLQLSQTVMAKIDHRRTMSWGRLMSFVGMGVDPHDIMKIPDKQVDWERIDRLKMTRYRELIDLLAQSTGVDLYDNRIEQCSKFSELMALKLNL